MELKRIPHLKGGIRVLGDKSISRRAVILGSIAKGLTEIHNSPQGADCPFTITCFEKMGTNIESKDGQVSIHDHGLHGLEAPREILDCGNSGITTYLISKVLCVQKFDITLTGDESICERPTKCIMDPLTMMGAHITSTKGNDCTLLRIKRGPIHGIHYGSRVTSAQVKSVVMLAGLYANNPTGIIEPYVPRNHSELMLRLFGVQVSTEGATAAIKSASEPHGNRVMVPGDISFVAYFIAGGLMVSGSEVLICNADINPTKDGILCVCCDMGAYIEPLNVSGGIGE